MANPKAMALLRSKNTRASNAVRADVRHLLTGEAKWAITGELTTRQDVLPSWWPFWSDVLKGHVREAVRAARKLAAAEGRTL